MSDKAILIVDDEPAFMAPIIELLKLDSISDENIIYCTQIDEAFSALNLNKNIVCVSLDLLMGDNMNLLRGTSVINGIRALSKIRELYPALPIVCFSILREEEGGIRDFTTRYNALFISKTAPDGTDRLLEFYKEHYANS